MDEEINMIQKLSGILEPMILKEAQEEMDSLGSLTEATKQSIAKIKRAKEMVDDFYNNGYVA